MKNKIIKTSWILGTTIVAFLLFFFIFYPRVRPGYVGVKVTPDGVDSTSRPVGRHFVGLFSQLYEFPTFEVNYVWTKSSNEGQNSNDESITFQTNEGLTVNTDIGITMTIEPHKVIELFQRYRRPVDEIVDGPLRNKVRDALNRYASTMTADGLISHKNELMDSIQKYVAQQVSVFGIQVQKIYLIGEFRLPQSVMEQIELKIKANQIAIQRENELREAEAVSKKRIIEAEAIARKTVIEARADSTALVSKAHAESEANRLRLTTLTPLIIQRMWIEKWNGALPTHSLSPSTSYMIPIQ